MVRNPIIGHDQDTSNYDDFAHHLYPWSKAEIPPASNITTLDYCTYQHAEIGPESVAPCCKTAVDLAWPASIT